MEVLWVRADADAIYLYIATTYIKQLELKAIYQACLKQLYIAANTKALLPVEPAKEVLITLDKIYNLDKDELYRIYDLLHYVKTNPAPFVSTQRLVTILPEGLAHSVHSHELDISIQTDLLHITKAVNPFIASLFKYEGILKKLDDFIDRYKGKEMTKLVIEAVENVKKSEVYNTKAQAKHGLIEQILSSMCESKKAKSSGFFQKDHADIHELALLIDQSCLFFSRIACSPQGNLERICREYRIDQAKFEMIKNLSQHKNLSCFYGYPYESEFIYKKVYEEEHQHAYQHGRENQPQDVTSILTALASFNKK